MEECKIANHSLFIFILKISRVYSRKHSSTLRINACVVSTNSHFKQLVDR